MHRWFFGALAFLIIGTSAYMFYPKECYSIRSTWNIQGSQGYRTWNGEMLKSFEHKGRPVCVPEGWTAIGALETNGRHATFEKDKTGIIIKDDAFVSKPVLVENSSYRVTLVYPKFFSDTEAAFYENVTRNAFVRVGTLFNDKGPARLPYTILVTSGLSTELIYPDPNKSLSIYIREPRSDRGEELLIHAVTHAYNRFSDSDTTYLENQAPFSAEEFEELEATWTEIAYGQFDPKHLSRIRYLYRVHTAIMTRNYSQLEREPFNDPTRAARIIPRIAVPENSSFLDFQYGHYILAPLVMVGIDGLLAEKGSSVTVESLLIDIHAKGEQNFFTRLQTLLSEQDMKTITSWVEGHATIPWPTLEKGASRY